MLSILNTPDTIQRVLLSAASFCILVRAPFNEWLEATLVELCAFTALVARMFRPVIGNSASAIPIAINCIFMGRDENEIPHKFISARNINLD